MRKNMTTKNKQMATTSEEILNWDLRKNMIL